MTSAGASTALTVPESNISSEPVRGVAALGRGGISSLFGLEAGFSGGRSNGESPALGSSGVAGGVFAPLAGVVARGFGSGSRLNGEFSSLGSGTVRGTASPGVMS